MKRGISDIHMQDVTICYGMTETSPVSFQSRVDDPIDYRVSTVGRVHPHVECKIVDPETGAIVPRGQHGVRIGFEPGASDYSWSPHGDRIAFTFFPDAIYVINEDGSGLSRIASHLGGYSGLAWSPDGETFAYEGGYEGIFTLTFEERNPRLWRRGADMPEFSPDGTQLLYIKEGDTAHPQSYMVAPLEGGTPEPLAENGVPVAFGRSMDWPYCS